jgi:hypothetical protein
MASNTHPHLRPWSIVDDEELQQLRELRQLCLAFGDRHPDEVLYSYGREIKIGAIGSLAHRIAARK